MAIEDIEYVVINPDMPNSTAGQPTQIYVPKAGENIYGVITLKQIEDYVAEFSNYDDIIPEGTDVDNKLVNQNQMTTLFSTLKGVVYCNTSTTYAEVVNAINVGKLPVFVDNSNNLYILSYYIQGGVAVFTSFTTYGSNDRFFGNSYQVTNRGWTSAYEIRLQPLLSFDSTPTQNSANPVTSGGIYDAINSITPINAVDLTFEDDTLTVYLKKDASLIASDSISGIASEEFVNSSIATNTAFFIGTFSNVSSLLSYSGTVTNNDYANVMNSERDFQTTTAMNAYDKTLLTNFDYAWVPNGTKYNLYRFNITSQSWGNAIQTGIDKDSVVLITAYNRYKYNSTTSTWNWEYTINNSGFTAAQWAAINSGITSEWITNIGNRLLTVEGAYVPNTRTIAGQSLDNNITAEELRTALDVQAGAEPNVQADWNETNGTSDSYIRHKPNIINANFVSNEFFENLYS